jgi:hypothetical protein
VPSELSVPARLHVLLARETQRAVVIRRGPSRHTAVIGWDRQTDTFTLGQWLHGRIYERRCDLSPDGRYLIYFAMNGHWTSPVKGSWTAISQAPYLKALCLFAKGDCWHGGGLFQGATAYWLNDGYGHEVQQDDAQLRRVSAHPWHEQYGGECPGVYFIRLQRDGWQLRGTSSDGPHGQITLFEKPLDEQWVLRKHAHATLDHPVGRGVYYDTHALFHPGTQQTLSFSSWEWADLDGERLIWASNGCLHAGHLGPEGLRDQAVLYDFRPMQFQKIAAPY